MVGFRDFFGGALMPACTLYCEHCHSEQVKDLDDPAFALLLDQGWVRLTCEVCGQAKGWKLKLRRPEQQPKGPRGEPLRVLVLDDDPSTLKILEKMLAAGGYAAELAPSADEAMDKLQSREFDVIVCDIRMPGFSGPNLFRFLSVYMPQYAARVVFLTGDQSEKTLQFLEESGCPYTFKPINWEELRTRIAQIS